MIDCFIKVDCYLSTRYRLGSALHLIQNYFYSKTQQNSFHFSHDLCNVNFVTEIQFNWLWLPRNWYWYLIISSIVPWNSTNNQHHSPEMPSYLLVPRYLLVRCCSIRSPYQTLSNSRHCSSPKFNSKNMAKWDFLRSLGRNVVVWNLVRVAHLLSSLSRSWYIL